LEHILPGTDAYSAPAFPLAPLTEHHLCELTNCNHILFNILHKKLPYSLHAIWFLALAYILYPETAGFTEWLIIYLSDSYRILLARREVPLLA
jgi:hypothetical protein